MEIRTATIRVSSIKQHLLNRLMILKASAKTICTTRSPDAYFFSRTMRALSGLME
jgi:hypothetical protein